MGVDCYISIISVCQVISHQDDDASVAFSKPREATKIWWSSQNAGADTRDTASQETGATNSSEAAQCSRRKEAGMVISFFWRMSRELAPIWIS
jgi:hypothetical protein